MKHLKYFPVLFVLLLFTARIQAQQYQSTKGFVPNKGQLADTQGKLRPEIQYYTHGAMAWYFREDGWSIVLSQEEAPDKFAAPKTEELYVCIDDEMVLVSETEEPLITIPEIAQHRIDVQLKDASCDLAIEAKEAHPYYNNYYHAHCPDGITEVHPFKTITYKNAWEGIDIRFTLPNEGGVKYDFIVHPGVNPKDIGLEYLGAPVVILSEVEGLSIQTPLGPITETIPSVYGLDANNQKTKHSITANYQIKKSKASKRPTENRQLATDNSELTTVVSFKLSNYNKFQTLIIDPWATYLAGSSNDRMYGVAENNLGKNIVTGWSLSTDFRNEPLPGATNNAANAGNYDAVIVQFLENGVIEWATYYGGSGRDYALELAIDPNDNSIYVGGDTYSATVNDFPITLGAADNLAAEVESFLVGFNEAGLRQFATYFGGDGRDYCVGVAVDNNGNVIIAGYTESDNIPIAGVAYQNNYPGGTLSGYVARFSPIGGLEWSTYYGDVGRDGFQALTTNSVGAIILLGATTSVVNIASPGAYDVVYDGGSDFMLVRFDPAPPGGGVAYNRTWATYYGGANSEGLVVVAGFQELIDIKTDAADNIFIAGRTSSQGLGVGGWSPIHSSVASGKINNDFILARFTPGGNLFSSTYIGTEETEGFFISIDLNSNGEVIVVGNADETNTNGVVFPGFFIKDLAASGGKWRHYVAKFNNTLNQLICGTYLAYNMVADVVVNASGDIVLCGLVISGNPNYDTYACPAPPNVIDGPIRKGNGDGFVSKICSPCGEISKDLLITDELHDTNVNDALLAAGDSVFICKDSSLTFCLGLAFGQTACYMEESFRLDTFWTDAYLSDELRLQWTDLATGNTILPGTLPPYISKIDGSCITFTSNTGGVRQFLAEGWYGSCAQSRVITVVTQDFNLTAVVTKQPTCTNKGSGTVVVNSLGTAGPYSYEWKDAAGIVISQTANANDVLLAGENYTIEVTDASCGMRNTVLITVGVSPPVIKREDSTSAICGAITGEYEISVSGGAGAPYTISWYDTANAWTLQPALNNQTRVTLTCDIVYAVAADDGACTDTIYVQIPCTPAPLFAIDDKTDATCNQDNGCVMVSIANGLGNNSFSYQLFTDTTKPNWSLLVSHLDTNSTKDTICNLAPGNYGIELSDSLCLDTLYFTIDSISVPTLTLQNNSKSNCTAATGSLEATLNGGTAPHTYQWYKGIAPTWVILGGETALNLSNQSSGTYSLEVTDANGCKDTLEAAIGSQSTFSATLNPTTDATCDAANGEACLDIVPADDYTINWKDAANTAIPRADDLLCLEGLLPGDYTVDITDGQCDTSINITINNGGKLAAQLVNAVNPTCGSSNGSVCVEIDESIGNAITYQWMPSGQETQCAINLGAGIHSVTISDGTCTIELDTFLGDPGNVSAVLDTAIHTTCNQNNGCIAVHGQGGTGVYTYKWYLDGVLIPNQTNDTLCNIGPGNYEAEIDDGICSVKLPVQINALPAPEIQSVSVFPASCGDSNGEINIASNAGVGAHSYKWFKANDLNNPIATGVSTAQNNLDSGCYVVVVYDTYCTDSVRVCVPYWDKLQVSITDSTASYCGQNDGTATALATGGSGNYQYNWYSQPLPGVWIGNGTKVIGLASGCYAVIAQDLSYGCTDTAYYCVLDSAAPNISIQSITASSCKNDNGSACVTVAGGTGNYQYQWFVPTDRTTILSTSNCLDPAKPIAYRVVVYDGNCYDSLDITIPNDPAIALNLISKTDEYCEQNDGSITVKASLGTGNYNYTWYQTANGMIYGSTANINNLSSGMYCVAVYDGQCRDTLCTFIDSIPSPIATIAITDASCEQNNGAATAGATGGTGVYSYDWQDNANTSIGTGNTIAGLNAGNYSLIVTDGNCEDTVNFTIIMHASPVLTLLDQSNATCNQANGEATILASGGSDNYTFVWDGGLSHTESADTSTGTNIPAGTYCVIVDDGYCKDTLCFTITDPGLMSLTTSSTSDNCNLGQGTAAVQVTGGTAAYSYSWSRAGENTQSINNVSAGNYSVTVTDSNGCVQSATITVGNTRNQISASSYIDYRPQIPEARDTVFFQAYLEAGWQAIQWNSQQQGIQGTASNTTSIYYPQTGNDEVCLEVIDGNGCLDTLCEKITIERNVAIYIPNAFTPNNDDKTNENWAPTMVGITKIEGAIYDRWGKEVFEFNSLTDEWGGRLKNGAEAKQDSYVYVFSFTDRYGESYERRGTVTVVE
jgi:gliding motility-associated-like protein